MSKLTKDLTGEGATPWPTSHDWADDTPEPARIRVDFSALIDECKVQIYRLQGQIAAYVTLQGAGVEATSPAPARDVEAEAA